MSVEVLERPPVEAPAETPGVSTPLLEEPDEITSTYAIKLDRRRRKAASTIDSRGAHARKRTRSAGERRGVPIGLLVGLPAMIVVAVAVILGRGAEVQVELPPILEASDFGGVIEFKSTARVGTLLHAVLRQAPMPSEDTEFRSRVEHVVGVLHGAGYESVLLEAPDGTTIVSGPLDGVSVGPLGVTGT